MGLSPRLFRVPQFEADVPSIAGREAWWLTDFHPEPMFSPKRPFSPGRCALVRVWRESHRSKATVGRRSNLTFRR